MFSSEKKIKFKLKVTNFTVTRKCSKRLNDETLNVLHKRTKTKC